MDLDLLERARCGDRIAYRGVVALWGQRLLQIAALLGVEPAAAREALARLFAGLWPELPCSHSEQPFRATLVRALLKEIAGLEKPARSEATAQAGAVKTCLHALDPAVAQRVVLHVFAGMGAPELALVEGTSLGRATKALRESVGTAEAAAKTAGLDGRGGLRAAMTDAARGVALPAWFAEEAVEPLLGPHEGTAVRREIAAPAGAAWAKVLQPATTVAWTFATSVRVRGAALEPGTRILARGLIGGERRSRDESLVTRVEPERVLAWTTRARVAPWPRAIEFRWTLEIAEAPAGCRLTHRLLGVAFPGGRSGRFLRAAYARVADGVPAAMRAGVERLAQLLEGSPQGDTMMAR